MAWSEDDFRARVEARAKELGRSVTDVMKKACISNSYMAKIPKEGRSVGKLEAIARELGWSVCDIIGCKTPCGPPSYELIELAVKIADSGHRRDPDRAEQLPSSVSFVYRALARRLENNRPIDESVISTLEDAIRHPRRGS